MPEPGRLADDIDRAANSVGGYVEIRMEPPMPDTPTLRDAAEALLKAARHPLVDPAKPRDETRGEAPAALFATLRAALSAEDARRARAEAAIAHSDAALAAESIWKKWRNRKTEDLQDAEDAAARRLVDYDAARRRYEETCRG